MALDGNCYCSDRTSIPNKKTIGLQLEHYSLLSCPLAEGVGEQPPTGGGRSSLGRSRDIADWPPSAAAGVWLAAVALASTGMASGKYSVLNES